MNKLHLEDLPQQVQSLSEKLDNIERLFFGNSQVQQPETDRWFDINELCEYHPDKPAKVTVYAWVREGKIPYHKRGKKLAFLKSEIDENIKTGKVNPAAEARQKAEDFLTSKGGRK